MSREQSERFKLLVEQNEEKEKTLREENLRKLEEMKLENKDKEKKLKEKNQRRLSMLMEENKVQEALMLAKHEEEEKAVWKEECERRVATRQVKVPECPVSSSFGKKTQSPTCFDYIVTTFKLTLYRFFQHTHAHFTSHQVFLPPDFVHSECD